MKLLKIASGFFLCIALAVCLLFLPSQAEAAYANIDWNYYGGTLYLYGNGDMQDYESASKTSWFSERDLITSIVIGDGITSVGNNAFNGYDNLVSVTIPSSVTRIGEDAFFGCTSLSSISFSEGLTHIGDYAFYGCGLKTADFPESLTHIGDYAFYKCYWLTTVNIPKNLTRIGVCAFYNCRLKTVDFPESLTYVDDYAFSKCNSLTEVTLPASLSDIAVSAFSGCTELTGIWVQEGHPKYSSDAYGVLYNKDQTKLLYIPAKVSEAYGMPDSILEIDDSALLDCTTLEYTIYDNAKYFGTEENPYFALITAKNTGITGCQIHPDTRNIQCGAFALCSNLKSIVIPEGVTVIGDDAFSRCYQLKSVSLPDSLTTLGVSAFEHSALTEIAIPEGITSIEYGTFSYCSLKNVEIPESVTAIADNAFTGCANLTSITIPNSVTTIGAVAFYECSGLKTVYYVGTEAQWNAIEIGEYNNPLTKATRVYLHQVSFRNWDGQLLQTQHYLPGDSVTPPAEPTRPHDDTHYYVFAGWTPAFSSICVDAVTYTATYTAHPKQSTSAPAVPYVLNISASRAELLPVEGCEYSADGKTWQDSNILTGLAADTTYTFYQRRKATETAMASPNSAGLQLKTLKKTACPIRPVDPVVADISATEITLVAQEGYEYRMGDGEWTDSPVFGNLEPKTSYTFYQRFAESGEHFAGACSNGVTATTMKAGTVTRHYYEQLRAYIKENSTYENGNYILITEVENNIIYTYKITNKDEHIQFLLTREDTDTSGFYITNEIMLYPDKATIDVVAGVEYFSLNTTMDSAYVDLSINRSTWTSGQTFPASVNGYAGLIPGQHFTELSTAAMQNHCDYLNDYFRDNLGFSLKSLGFISYFGFDSPVCDLPSEFHWGVLKTYNVREAGCVMDGYTGDIYCTDCGFKVRTGERIPSTGGHLYDDACDSTCNVCSQDRLVLHTYRGICDTGCEACGATRLTDYHHSFENTICTVCGTPDRLPGDLDDNPVVNTDDVVALLLYISMPDIFGLPAGVDADFNGDSNVTTDDAVLLLLHISMPDIFPL